MSFGTGLEWLDELERNLARAARSEGPETRPDPAGPTPADRARALKELRRRSLRRWDRANLADAYIDRVIAALRDEVRRTRRLRVALESLLAALERARQGQTPAALAEMARAEEEARQALADVDEGCGTAAGPRLAGADPAPASPELRALGDLAAEGVVEWEGGKPRGAARPPKARGHPVSGLVVDGRRHRPMLPAPTTIGPDGPDEHSMSCGR